MQEPLPGGEGISGASKQRDCPRRPNTALRVSMGAGDSGRCCPGGDKLGTLQSPASHPHACTSQLTYLCAYVPSMFRRYSRPFLGDGVAPGMQSR